MVDYTPAELEGLYNSLDRGISKEVEILMSEGVETFESCEGGDGHAYPEPTVRFHGERSEGWKALSVALQNNLKVAYWEMVFRTDRPISG